MTRLRSDLPLMLIAALWGSSFILNQLLLERLEPAALGAWRFALAGLILLALALREPGSGTWKRACGPAIATGVVNGAAYFTLNQGLPHLPAGEAAFLLGGSSVVAPLLGYVFLHQRIRTSTAVGVAISTAGLALLSGALGQMLGGSFGQGLGQGQLMLLISAVLFAVQVVMTGKASEKKVAGLAFLSMQLGVAAGINLLALLLGGGQLHAAALISSPVMGGCLLILAVPGTALAYLVQTQAQKRGMPASRVAMIFLLEPVFASAVDYLALGRVMHPAQALGAGMILAGLAAASLPERDRRQRRSPAPESHPQHQHEGAALATEAT